MRHAGLAAVGIAAHVTAQTSRTVRSSTAYQQYWTGIVRARDVLGKFTFVPTTDVSPVASRGSTVFTDDWRARQSAGDLALRTAVDPVCRRATDAGHEPDPRLGA